LNTTFIYVLKCPLSGEVRYVGKSNNPDERYKDHLNRSRDGGTYKRNWINSLRKNNLKPIFEIIKEVSVGKWKIWEKYYIKHYRDKGCKLVNIMGGGDGLTFGNQTSFKKGHIPWIKGHKGVVSNRKGCTLTLETRQKISNSLKDRFNIGNSKPVLQLDKDTGKIINEFPSTAEAGRVTNIDKSRIVNTTNGYSKTAGGFKWKKKEDL